MLSHPQNRIKRLGSSLAVLLALALCVMAASAHPVPEKDHAAGAVQVLTDEVETLTYDPLPVAHRNEKDVPAIFERVADYDTRLDLWEIVPGNHPARKADRMNIDFTSDLDLAVERYSDLLSLSRYADAEQEADTLTYFFEIERGFEKETSEDMPYLIPYPVRGAKGAVIVLPGGGFTYKTTDGGTGEGKDVAMMLNEAGYSAFVLHYRANPYEYPLPLLDVQRAVRYVRYHAEEFGFDGASVGLIGFSAGAYEAAAFLNLVAEQDLFPEDYVPDTIDKVSDAVTHAAYIYPMLDFRHNVPMLFALFDAGVVRDDDTRAELLDSTDLSLHFTSEDVPQMICYGATDSTVGTQSPLRYAKAAASKGASFYLTSIPDRGHVFPVEYYRDLYLDWLAAVR